MILTKVRKNLKIVFMGTPEFAVPSLEILVKNNYNIEAVVTAPDKPAGRGLQLQQSPIKKYALQKGIRILQPFKLRDPDFQQELKEIGANLFIVVAFRMLPEIIWQMPKYGTFNLHASLLPDYRGAAPINWAVINGEERTGLTTFFLKHEIDTGEIIFQENLKIPQDITAGELHDKMMQIGADLVLKTVQAIEKGVPITKKQPEFSETKKAPKIFKDDCKINWVQDTKIIYNQIRGLSPYPGAWTILNGKKLKIFHADPEYVSPNNSPGDINTDGKNYLKIATSDGSIMVKELQIEGRKRMSIVEFLRGFSIKENSHVQ
jgi:methionyl-tRNA formyltransferase